MRAPTKAEHDAYVNARGRSYTADWMRPAHRDDTDNDMVSPVDNVISQLRRRAS